ncbi:hypothetical protein AB0D22_35525 [Kitasatospora sp. NPDC048538]|uniref:hypothetical protein n=1 Tax=Kitasatospora sp. NPDC048538 TaxID=3155633 RepID=UPI00340717D9
MTLELQHAAQQRMRRIIIGLVALVLILVGGVVGLVLGQDDPKPTAGPAAAPTVTPSAPDAPAPLPTETAATTYTAPTIWVNLPAGGTKRDGLPVQWPHTPEGAAAAAVAAVRSGWTWDAATAERAAGVYAAPADAATMREQARQSTEDSRASVGLPRTGDLPTGAHMAPAVIGVQWTPVNADQVTVSVLARVTFSTGNGTPDTTRLISLSSPIAWSDGDWHTKAGSPGRAPEPFDLGSAGFNSAGWRAIQEGDAR